LLFRIYKARNGILEGWDESIYTQLGVEFVKNPSFTLYYNNQVWVEKPFLIGFITGIIQFIAPYNKVLLQSFFAIISLVNLYFVWKLANKCTPNKLLALFAPIFVINTYLFFERATTVNTDTVLVFGLLGYYIFKDKFWIKVLFLCISVWSKSLLGFLPLLLDITLNFKESFHKNNRIKTILAFFIPSIWYFYSYLRYGNEFIQKHFIEQIFSRASTTLENHTGDWWFYFDYFAKTSPLAFILLMFSFVIGISLIFKKNTKWISISNFRNYEPAILGILYLILFSSSKSKLEWYLLPVIYLVSPIIPKLLSSLHKTILTPITKLNPVRGCFVSCN
jgi:hypothetical protein